MRRLIFFVLVSAGITTVGHAQNNTSAYSIIGIGDIEKSTFDRTTGMGHAGIALSSNRFFYQNNPASFASLDEHFFYFEASTRFKSVTYTGTPIVDITKNQSSDLQFKKLGLATKIKPYWAISFGLTPFSTVNYSFNGKKVIEGSGVFTDAYYQGTGGTNQAYITNSFAINKNFSVGLQSSFLFGQLDETETLAAQYTDSSVVTTRNIALGNPLFKLGMQYRGKLNKKWNIALGGTVSPETKLRANYSILAKSGNTILKEEDSYKTEYSKLPLTVTGGIAATLKGSYTFAVDYNYQGWKQLNINGFGYTLQNSQRVSAGFEFSKKGYYLDQAYEKYFLQAGGFYTNSYLRINGEQLKDYGITFGAGAELSRTALTGLAIQAGLELGQRGTTSKGLIQETYTQFNITLSYRDFWFSRKMKKYE